MKRQKNRLRNLGTIKTAATSKSGSGKLFESVKQSQWEIPCGAASSLSIEDIENKIVVLFPKHNSDYPFRTRASKASKQIVFRLEKVLIETIKSLPLELKNTYPCAGAIRNSRFE